MGEPRLTSAAVQILIALGAGDRHGYGIMTDVASATGGRMQLGPGTLYATLARLEADGLIEESPSRPDPAHGSSRTTSTSPC